MGTIRSRKRGSAIIGVLIVGVVVLFVVTGYLRSSLNQLSLANQSQLTLSLDSLLDAAADQSLSMLHSGDNSDWRKQGSLMWRHFNQWRVDEDTPADVWVALEETKEGLLMLIYAAARERSGRLLERTAEVHLRRQSPFTYGLEVHDGFTFNGANIELDSFDSRVGPYSASNNRNDRLIVLSPSSKFGSAAVNNARIFGMLYIGAAEALVLRPQAEIKTRATSGGGVDERAIRRDIRLDRPYPVPMPSATNRILWPGGDVIQIGDQSGFTTENFVFEDLDIKSGQVVNVVGPVRWIVQGDLKLQGELVIEGDGELQVFLAGDLQATGGAIINSSDQPARMSLFVTATEPTRLQLAGNSTFAGSIHAPYAQLELSGSGNNGRFKGAAVLGSITINGRYQFHFDEALRFSQQPMHRYAVIGWRKPSRDARDLPTQLSDNLSDSESLHASGL